MDNKGFTLIELLVTISLLAIIAIISFVSINAVIEKNEINNCKINIDNIKSAYKLYVSDNRYKKTKEELLEATISTLKDEKYLVDDIDSKWENADIEAALNKNGIITSITITLNHKKDYCICDEMAC